jgi:DNA mismatch endonuclease (patch repair protein)
MADVHSPETRSFNMSRIRGKHTKPELLVRTFLHHQGFRYRLHNKHLPGKPDIVLKKFNSAIFIHGCFWHGHDGCKFFKIPQTRSQWWKEKIYGNKSRDEKNIKELADSRWKVIIIWECELLPDNIDSTLKNLASRLGVHNVDSRN